MILGDAYAKCQVPEVRTIIAGVVRRAFLGHGIRGKDDGDFVKNAMQWYQQRKDRLTVNFKYASNIATSVSAEEYDAHPELYEREISEREQLFVDKEERKGGGH